ncbi:MAG: porin, partial [Gammaproteobacteria bacterium]|nr:porin [Gammaproteobacteria bacterium]
LSGTALSSSSNHQDNWGNYRITPTQTWDSIFTMQDSLSRTNRLRYDTPAFSGFSFAASIGQGSATELAARYSGNWGDTKFKAALFVSDTADFGGLGTDTDIIGGSASLLLGGGFNITIAFSDVDPTGGLERDAQTIKLGYKRGIHAYAIDFGEGTTGSEDADTVGLTYAAHVYKGIEIFGTYRQLDSDKVAGAQSIDIFAFGSRVKF